MRKVAVVLAMAALGIAVAARAEIVRAVLACGGGISSSPEHTVVMTLGQPVAGTAAGPGVAMVGGYWAADYPVEGVDEASESTPGAFVLRWVGPNPARSRAVVRFDAPAPGGHVEILVCDVAGRRVRTLHSALIDPGRHEVIWDGHTDSGRPAGSGTYLVVFGAGGRRQVQRLVLLR